MPRPIMIPKSLPMKHVAESHSSGIHVREKSEDDTAYTCRAWSRALLLPTAGGRARDEVSSVLPTRAERPPHGSEEGMLESARGVSTKD